MINKKNYIYILIFLMTFIDKTSASSWSWVTKEIAGALNNISKKNQQEAIRAFEGYMEKLGDEMAFNTIIFLLSSAITAIIFPLIKDYISNWIKIRQYYSRHRIKKSNTNELCVFSYYKILTDYLDEYFKNKENNESPSLDGLLCVGEPGTGKTYITEYILEVFPNLKLVTIPINEFIENKGQIQIGKDVFIPLNGYIKYIQSLNQKEEKVIVVIDEINRLYSNKNNTSSAEVMLLQTINTLIESGIPVIAMSNQNIEEMNQELRRSGRLGSRIQVELTDKDYKEIIKKIYDTGFYTTEKQKIFFNKKLKNQEINNCFDELNQEYKKPPNKQIIPNIIQPNESNKKPSIVWTKNFAYQWLKTKAEK